MLAALVAACAIGSSVPGALSDPLWSDEVASARIVSEQTIGEVLARIRRTESAPPAWYVAAWSVSKADARITGGRILEPVERLRMLSVLFAAAASVLTALWALRLLADRLLAALAGFLVALGSVPAAYAEQLRAYALLTLLAVTFGLLLVRVSSRFGAWTWLALALSTGIGMLTHYFFFFTVGAGLVWLWTSRPQPAGGRRATLALVVGVLAFAPWLPGFVAQAQQGRYSWIGPFDAASVFTLPGSLFFGPEGTLYGIARIALSAALVMGAVVLWRRPGGRAIVALGLLPIGGAAVIWAFGQPIFNERNMLAITPYLAILVAASLLRLPKRLVTPIALTGLVAAVLGAAFAQLTLGRIAYDGVASGLVDLGWSETEPIAVDPPTGRTSLRVAVGWYLPGHTTLVRARGSRRACPALFAIGHSNSLAPWLERNRGRLVDVREFAAYDHPFRGRRDGRILVVRLRQPVHLPGGDVLYVRDHATSCPPPRPAEP